jgi:glutathione-regulated potassium-efflux system protein KefB
VIGFALALSSTPLSCNCSVKNSNSIQLMGKHPFPFYFSGYCRNSVIAVIPILAGTQTTHHGIAYFAAIVATFTGLFLFSRIFMRPFFRFVVKVVPVN